VSIVLAFTMATLTCAVCLDAPKRPVVTRCGHLMCWECLRQWGRQERASRCRSCGLVRCPVCKTGIDPDSDTDVRPILGVEDHGSPPAAQASSPKRSMDGPDRTPEPQRNGRFQFRVFLPFLFAAWTSDTRSEMDRELCWLVLIPLAVLVRWLGRRLGIQNPFFEDVGNGVLNAFTALLLRVSILHLLHLAESLGLHPSS
jgi:hypothetical protein